MSTKVITTFSIDGYELYGKRMVNTWLQYWPSNFELTVYTEGFNLLEKDSKLKEIDINDACPTLKIFKEKSLDFIDPKNKKTKSRIAKAIRWSHKIYAMSHALNQKCDYLIFLDGDTFSKDYIPTDFAERLVQNHLFAVHFEFLQRMLHFETGLICFNTKHQQMPLFRSELQKGYDSLDIHKLPKPWDGFYIAYLATKYNLDVLNLAQRNSGVFSNPLVRPFLTHEAGKAKFHKSSIEYDKYSGRKKQ